MSFNGRTKTKSKSPNRGMKKPPRVEAIKVTIERKKICNDKALQIVTEFSEGTISERMLLDNLKFINQEHYQDIVEERAINKLCGYPLCSNLLNNIPSKQYHISTTLNKVFDITDRKNYCSNLCYKASKFLKDQVSLSPLWLREDESTSFTLLSLQSKGGMKGDEVDLGVSPVKLNSDDALTKTSSNLSSHSTSEVVSDEYTKESEENQNNCSTGSSSNFSVVGDKTKCQISKDDVRKNLGSCRNNRECAKEQKSEEETSSASEVKTCVSSIYESPEKSNDSAKPPGDSEFHSRHAIGSQEYAASTSPDSLKKINIPSDSLTTGMQSGNSDLKSHKHRSKRKSSTKKTSLDTNPLQNIVFKIEQVLREWISVDSLCFVLGEEKLKEILAEKKSQNLPAFTQDIHFYERYLAICKKLNILELEETKVDASYRVEAKKPLPDYEALKEEARQMEIKVKMFFKGDRVQFEPSEKSKEVETRRELADSEPVLPLVDVHAQKALRRRIVVDKLRRILQDLQKSLGLRAFNLTQEVKSLVGTLSLSAHNITMKPAEWNLISIAIIKLLSLRDKMLAEALNSSIANKHLTLLLMSFSLDAGYLDRLMVWLTDIEAVLQKT